MKIDFSEKNTRSIAIGLYKRMIQYNSKYQNLTLFTGYGKTAISVATAGIFAVQMKQDINVFILAPKKKIEDQSFQKTIEQYNEIAEYKLNIIGCTTPQSLVIAYKNDKLLKKEIKQMSEKVQNKLIFFKDWKKQVDDKPTIILIDESQMFKNPTSKRGKALKKLMENAIAIGLSANPMPNGKLDDGVGYLIYNDFYKNQQDFRDQHIPFHFFDEYYQPQVFTKDHEIDPKKFKGLNEFNEQVKRTMYAPIVEVNFNIPQRQVHTSPYDLTQQTIDEMQDLHKEFKKGGFEWYIQYLAKVKRAIGTDRGHAQHMADTILQHPDTQPLIFYETYAELEVIEEKLQEIEMPYTIINGRTKKGTLTEFNHEDRNQAVVIQYKAGGMAIEFKKSRLSIFYSLVYSWGDIEQAMGRNVRRGESRDEIVNQIYLLATHPHDAKVFDVIERKARHSHELLEEVQEELADSQDRIPDMMLKQIAEEICLESLS